MNTMLLKEDIIKDSKNYFKRSFEEIYAETSLSAGLFAVHIRPKESHIRTIPYIDRLTYVEDLIERVIRKIQSHLIKRPTRPHNRSLLIRSKNFIESHTKYGAEDIHHSHGIWCIHSEIYRPFERMLRPFDRSLINVADRVSYSHRDVYTLSSEIMEPLQDEVHSILIEKCHDLDLLLDYCTKNIGYMNGINQFGTYDTNTKDTYRIEKRL